jgi:hypothetical protein
MAKKATKRRRKKPDKGLRPYPMQLAAFRLLACSVAMLPRSETTLPENTCNVELHFTWYGNENTYRLWFDMTAILHAVSDVNPDEFASISATYRVSFNVKDEDFFPRDHKRGNMIANVFVSPMVWPHWRQFFNEMLLRVGFPPFVLPILEREPTIISENPISPPVDSTPPPTAHTATRDTAKPQS